MCQLTRSLLVFLVLATGVVSPIRLTRGAWNWRPVGGNLVANPSFEEVGRNGVPVAWDASPAYYQSNHLIAHDGQRSVKYENDDPAKYVFCRQKLEPRPGVTYRIRAHVKTRDIAGEDSGATMCLEWQDKDGKYIGGCYPKGVKGTSDWTLVEGVTRSLPKNAASMVIQCYVRRQMTGEAWYDNVEVVRVQAPPMDSVVLSPVYRGRITKDGPESARIGVSVELADYEDVRREQVRLEWRLTTEETDERVNEGTIKGDAFHTSFDSGNAYEFDVPTRSLAVGDYVLSLRLLDGNGQQLDADEHGLTRVPDDFSPVATIDRHQRLIVRGKPFFPIGMYWSRINEDDLKIYSNSHFNCMMPYATPSREQMDLAERYGVKVIYSIKDWYYGHRGCPNWIESIEEEEPAVRQRVRDIRDHPALLAWYLNDELPLRFMPQLNAHQRFVAEEDPHHPTWVVLYQVNTVRKYLKSLDVIGSDPYPIGRTGDLNRASLAADWTQITYDQVYRARPMWQVPQAFNWANYRQRDAGWDPANFRSPRKAELRSMTWQCITEGARGIIFYSWYDLRRNPDMPFEESWDNLEDVAAELDRFAPILLSVERAPNIRIESATSREAPTWLHAIVRKANGKVYIFTANDGDGDGTVRFVLPEQPKSVREVTEDAHVKSNGTCFEVKSEPLDVKIYEVVEK